METNEAVASSNKSEIFRANMNFVHMLYRAILKIAPLKTDKYIVNLTDECFYKMIGTNPSDLSKYKNGKLGRATKPMQNRTQECMPLYQAIMGERLLYKDISLEKWDEVYRKDADVREQIERLVSIVFKMGATCHDKAVFEVVQWMTNKIAIYLKEKEEKGNEKVKRLYNELGRISFEELEACSKKELDEISRIIRNQSKMVSALAEYKSHKED